MPRSRGRRGGESLAPARAARNPRTPAAPRRRSGPPGPLAGARRAHARGPASPPPRPWRAAPGTGETPPSPRPALRSRVPSGPGAGRGLPTPGAPTGPIPPTPNPIGARSIRRFGRWVRNPRSSARGHRPASESGRRIEPAVYRGARRVGTVRARGPVRVWERRYASVKETDPGAAVRGREAPRDRDPPARWRGPAPGGRRSTCNLSQTPPEGCSRSRGYDDPCSTTPAAKRPSTRGAAPCGDRREST